MNIKTLKSIKSVFGRNRKGLPILDCFLIDSQYLYFSRLNLMVKVKHFFPFKEGSPAIVVNANNFIARVATIKAPYHINSDITNRITFTNADTVTLMRGDNPSDFPTREISYDYKELFILEWNEIQLMNIAKSFTADDDLRPIMEAVCISQDHIVASDAHKLYYRKIYKKSELDLLIDQKAVSLMMLSNGSNFKVSCYRDNFRAESEDMSIYWKSAQSVSNNLIDSGNYPQWRNVIPKTDKQVTIPVNEFIEAINSTAFATSISGLLRIEIKNASLTIIASNLDFDISASEKINILNPNNVEIIYGVKRQFLKEILQLFKDEGRPQITMAFTDNTHAFIFADMVLLMPMMINTDY